MNFKKSIPVTVLGFVHFEGGYGLRHSWSGEMLVPEKANILQPPGGRLSIWRWRCCCGWKRLSTGIDNTQQQQKGYSRNSRPTAGLAASWSFLWCWRYPSNFYIFITITFLFIAKITYLFSWFLKLWNWFVDSGWLSGRCPGGCVFCFSLRFQLKIIYDNGVSFQKFSFPNTNYFVYMIVLLYQIDDTVVTTIIHKRYPLRKK